MLEGGRHQVGADELARLPSTAVVDIKAQQCAVVTVAGDASNGDSVVRLAVLKRPRVAPQHAAIDHRDHTVTLLQPEREPLDRLSRLGVGRDTVVGQDRCLLGRERPAGLTRSPRHPVQFVTARGVDEGVGLGYPNAELIQHVGTADDAAVTTVMLGVVALQVVERGIPAHVADGQARSAVGQLAWLNWDVDGRITQPAGSFFFCFLMAVRIQNAAAAVLR